MGADADGVALVPAVSYGIAIAAANTPLAAGQNVVVLDRQFPSNVYAWRELAGERGAKLRTARKEPADSWTEAVLDAIDDDTAVVAVPNCHWTDGALVDLGRVGERARAVGSALIVDASQSLGAYPISVEEVQPDFLVSVGYKWQLGPYGLAYLYAAPKWRERSRPLEASWLTRAGADDFSSLVDYVDEYQPGARRFDMGEYPQFILLPMALAAVRQLLEWEPKNIQATIAKLTASIAREARSLGLSVLDADKRVGHMLGIRFPAGLPAGLPKRLADARVYVSVRGDAIRVSPNVYNSENDAARLVDVLREFA
jgi:selenocysteine lyase/cysteine desulfurase